MRTLLVLNPKGGSGKSTVAMNIAGYYAQSGAKVAIVDGSWENINRFSDRIQAVTPEDVRAAARKYGRGP